MLPLILHFGSSDFEPASSFFVPSRKHYKFLLLLLLLSGTFNSFGNDMCLVVWIRLYWKFF